MCGIAGIFQPSGATDLDVVKRMTDAIRHRGPDGEGHWCNPSAGITLGHRRLSIIDLSDNASQPMHYADGRYTIVFNGEIYNYVELKRKLLDYGYRFRSHSDTEVLLALYDSRKEACLQELDGMFAFALWDEREQLLFCARDRFGEKPLFYHYRKDRGFLFASEMKALWAAGVVRRMDPMMLAGFVADGKCLTVHDQASTFYEQIRQIDSGHYLTISAADFVPRLTRYYSLDGVRQDDRMSPVDAAHRFRSILTESVRRRLRSDVPVGTSLSGGLDSSSVALLMDEVKSEGMVQKSFSARFKNYERDEGHYMNLVVRKSRDIQPLEVWPDIDEMHAVMDRLIHHQEEPFSSASVFAQWKVMELAKKSGVSVLLDGQGADEQLAGYLYYYNVYLAQLYQHDYPLFQKEVLAMEHLRGVRHPLHPASQTVQQRLGRLKRQLFRNTVSIPATHLRNHLANDMMRTGLKELLRYADRNSMAHSVEVRLPFLDHRLVEFVFSLPDSYKLSGGWTKLVLRKGMEDLLPPEITWRIDKVAYEAPQDDWLASVRSAAHDDRILQYLSDAGLQGARDAAQQLDNWRYYLLLRMQDASDVSTALLT